MRKDGLLSRAVVTVVLSALLVAGLPVGPRAASGGPGFLDTVAGWFMPDRAEAAGAQAAPQSLVAPAPARMGMPSTPARTKNGEPERVRELTWKRTETSKSFIMSDGTTQMELSPSPVHYRDGKGKWQDIDTTVVAGEEGDAFQNIKNGFRSRYGKTTTRLLTFENDGASITVGASGDSRKVSPAADGSTVTFADVFGGADVRYEVTSGGVKEDIVLESADEVVDEYSFELRTNGFVAKVRGDGAIEFYKRASDERPALVIPAPYMYDSSADNAEGGAGFSNNVSQTVTQRGGVIEVAIKPDTGWLASDERVYPVRIDPTITVVPDSSSSQDAYIDESNPSTNYSGNNWLTVGSDRNADELRSLLQFDLSMIPYGTVVRSADLKMHFSRPLYADDGDVQFVAHRVDEPWTDSDVTWDTMPAWNTGGTTFTIVHVDDQDPLYTSHEGPWEEVPDPAAYRDSYSQLASGTTPDTFTWNAWLPGDGDYEVDARYQPRADRGSPTYVVTGDEGSATATIDQTSGTNSAYWRSLGSQHFAADEPAKVTMTRQGGSTATAPEADAVRFIEYATVTKPSGQSDAWHSYAVGEVVKRWVDGRSPNYGLMLKVKSTQPAGGVYYQDGDGIWGDEVGYRPKLVITYDEPGVDLKAPSTIHAGGPELSWSKYIDPSPEDGDNLVEYQVFRGCKSLPGGACTNPVGDYFHTSDPAGLKLVGTVAADVTSWTDTTAQSSTASEEATYNYWVVARTEADIHNGQDGRAASNARAVTTAREGRVLRVFSGDIADTTLSAAMPNTTLPRPVGYYRSPGEWLQVGNSHPTYGDERAVLEFDTSEIKQAVKVTDAELRLFESADSVTGGATFDLHALTRDFVEDQATWNDATSTIGWSKSGGDHDAAVLDSLTTGGNVGPLTYDAGAVRNTVQEWVDNPGDNHGFLMKTRDETASQQFLSLISSESSDELFRPQLIVEHLAKNAAETFEANEVPERFVPGTIVKTPVTVTNTSDQDWPAGLELSYRWTDPGDTEDLTTSGERNYVPLSKALAVGESERMELPIRTPINSDTGAKRQAYDLYLDLWDRPNNRWFSETNPPSSNTERPSQDCRVMTTGLLCVDRFVEDPRSNLGLEKFFSYTGEETGGGPQLLTELYGGNVVWSYDVFSIPSIGPSTFVRLAYNSMDVTDSGAGFGVSVQPSTLTRLGGRLSVPDGGSTANDMTFIDGDGTTHEYKLDTQTSTKLTYVRPPGVALELSRDLTAPVDRQWVLTRPDGTRFFFDQDTGRQTAVVDRNSNTMSFVYDASGRLTDVRDASGRTTLTLGYDAAGLVWMSDISGRGLKFTYNSSHQLIKLEDGGGFDQATGTFAEPERVKTFQLGYTEQSVNSNAKLNSVIDPRGKQTTIEYYPSNEVSFYKLWPKRYTDRRGNDTTFTYADPDSSAAKDIVAEVTDVNGIAPSVTTYRMDGYGRTTSIKDANANAESKDELTKLGWDQDHNVIRLEEPNGAVSTWEYDPVTGYPLKVRDAMAVKNNQPGMVMEYERATGPGNPTVLVSKTSPAGRESTFTYDANGNLKTTRNGLGFGYTYTYNSDGTLLTAMDARGGVTEYGAYDATGYPKLITDPGDAVSEFTYDPRGNVIQVEDPLHRVTTAEYDEFGRQVAVTTPHKDTETATTDTSYDLNDNVVTETAPNGAVTSYEYDSADNVTVKTLPDNNVTGRKITYEYDALSRKVKETAPKGVATTDDPDDFATRYGYDRIGQLVRVETPFKDADGTTTTPTWTYEYDVVGNMIAEIDPNKNASSATDYTTKWTYDLNHRVTAVTDAAGYTSKNEYDADGLLTDEIDQLGNRRRTVYDDAGQKIELHVPHTPVGSTTTQDRVTKWEYDRNGNVIKEIRPSGKFSETVYDANNRPVQKKRAFDPDDARYNKPAVTYMQYDDAGQLSRQSDPTYELEADADWTEYTYYPSGEIETSTDPWQITTTYGYDKIGNQTSRVLQGAGDDAKRSQSWSFHPDGSLKTHADTEAQQPVDVLDDLDTWQTAMAGTWDTQYVIGNPNVVASRYREHAPAAAGSPEADDSFTWELTPDVGGTFDLFASCVRPTDSTSAARYTINHDTGSSSATVDQSACTSETPWVKLGNFTFSGGVTKTITLKPSADGAVAADAVKLVATGEPRTRSFTYAYDANGAQTEVKDTTSGAVIDTFKTSYDGLGRALKVQELAAGSEKRVTDYAYDLNSNMLSVDARRTAGSQSLAASRYTAYSWDVRDMVDTVKSGDTPTSTLDTWSYTYDPRGMVSTLTKPNDNKVTVRYHEDGLPRTTREYSGGVNGTKLVSAHTLKYTVDGDRSEDVEKVDRAGTSVTNYLDQTTRYAYTPAQKLSRVTKSGADHGSSESYTYDAAGNVTEQTIGSVSSAMTYVRNRLTKTVSGSTTTNHHYDVFGRSTTATVGSQVVERNAYDGFDRLIRQQKYGTDGSHMSTKSTSYDPFDRTSQQSVKVGAQSVATQTRFVYLGLEDQVAIEEQTNTSGAWEVSKRYTYAPDGSKLMLVDTPVNDSSSKEYFYSTNPHGDVEAVTDDTGQSTSTYWYSAYGTADEAGTTGEDAVTGDPVQDAELVNPYRFNSARFDGATGTYDMGFRDYDPGLNRFLTRDMYNGALDDVALGSDPWNTNRYAFAGGNPISRVEFDGHFGFNPLDSIGDAVDAVKDTASDVADAASEVASEVGEFVDDHKATIAGIATGVVAYAGCTAATGGAGAVACTAVAGAAGSAVENALNPNGDHSIGGYMKAAAGGAAIGVATLGTGRALAPVFKPITKTVKSGLGNAVGTSLPTVATPCRRSSQIR